ncbi:MAG: HupE/UreJ family protein [Gallionella sp.]|nr:HupE/UreJ family protein [Gallionella sp.]
MKKLSMHLLLTALCAICLLPISALAHTGTGQSTGFSTGFMHPAGGADHLLAMLAVGLWAAQTGGRAAWAVPGTFVSMMLAGGVLGMSGVHVPYMEAGIVVSVLVLGVLIAGAFKLPLAISGLLVGIFAVFHGHAHGAEMPIAVGAVSYSAGFALATALLHAAGILAGTGLRKLNIEKITRFAGGAIALSGIYLAVS